MLMLWLDSKQTKNEAGLLFNIFAAATMIKTLSAFENWKALFMQHLLPSILAVQAWCWKKRQQWNNVIDASFSNDKIHILLCNSKAC